ncbi:hypothetical protein [Dictyobacter arantiisoli]|uniref:Uncharacterized protein n=1 Tax=Dictyobacter arantiisoli TaxID=2014874 RepID=A0A5A5TI39_9CHLR|nr:hypothetical protein [Dictyobacter arantiisoli]GCF10858.1 hypothetical protein KDI_44220 [Dictyobacter arantiisoli]
MMKHLEGRNLAHPGCLIGVTLGLIVGMVLAGVLAAVFNVAFNTVVFTFLAITVGLGLVGWIIGAYLTTKQQLAAQRAQYAAANAQNISTDTALNEASGTRNDAVDR